MTELEARENAARVFKKAEKATTPEQVHALNDLGNSWLRLSSDIRWSEQEKEDRAKDE